MLTLKQIRDDKEAAVRKLAKKGVDAAPVIEKIIALDDRRKAIQLELDTTLAAQNKAAKEIGALMGQGRREEAEERKRFVTDLKEKSVRLQAESNDVQQELQATLVTLPNFPADIVPEGRTAEDNLVVKLVESYTPLPENPLPHWELARKYDIIDFDLGVKLTGAGFPVYKGQGARLQRALINYFLDYNTRAGYREVEPPVMVNEASGFGTGQLPDKEGQMYHATVDNFYLVPTAEVPVTNIFRDVILEKSDFPVKMTAYTPCFRREAGSYGKDVRGLNRLHQFDKVEIVQLSLPEHSYEALDGMRDSCSRSDSPTASCVSAAATCPSPRPSRTTSRYTPKRRSAGSRSPRSRTSSPSRQTASSSATATTTRRRNSPIRSTARRSPCRASSPHCSRISRPPKGSGSPRC